MAVIVGAFVPDLRGEFIRGWDHEKGADVGRTFGSWQADELKAHNHLNGIADNDGGFFIYNQTTLNVPGNATASVQNTPESRKYQGSTSITGGIETRGRNIALLPCIKY